MLKLPDSDEPLRIMSVDPGTDTLGVSLLEADTYENTCVVVNTTTLVGTELLKKTDFGKSLLTTHKVKYQRLSALRKQLYIYYRTYHPHVICCEGNFMGASMSSFASLVEAAYMVRNLAFELDPYAYFTEISPSEGKASVNLHDKKTKVRDAIKKELDGNNALRLSKDVHLDDLDEHGLDSIIIGYAFYKQLEVRKCESKPS